MKKLMKVLITVLGFMFIFQESHSQSTTFGAGIAGHTGAAAAGDYVGWLNNGIPLFLRTNYTAAPAGAGNRLIIMNGGFGTGGGQIALGNNLPNGFAPLDRLHLNQDAASQLFMRFTHPATINGGLRIGITSTGAAQIRQQENQPLTFHVWDGAAGAGTIERMRITANTPYTIAGITSGSTNNITRVGISEVGTQPIINPQALLHLGFPLATPNILGHRDWMDIGVFMKANTDNMYVGLKNEGTSTNNPHTDRMDAVINWGDNVNTPGIGPDALRFIFTGTFGAPSMASGTVNGLEIGRMWCDGNRAFTGFGGDNNFLNPYSGGLNPAQTLEVNSPFPTNVNGGSSGLRFTNLTDASPTTANTGNMGVLAVNSLGDVVYVPGGVGIGTCLTTPTTFPAGDNGAIDLSVNGNHNFYFEGQGITSATQSNSVGIGIICGNLAAKLDVMESSGSAATIGINSLNTDATGGVLAPSIGLKAKVTQQRNIAGWFESSSTTTSKIYTAIYVPENQGAAAIGYTLNNLPSSPITTLLWVNGDANFLGNPYPSDAILKTDTVPLHSGLNVVRNMRIMKYRYNGLAGLPTNRTYFGVIAEQLRTIAPYAVDTTLMALHENDTTRTPILRVRNEAVIYTAIKAIQQLDSSVTALQNMPSGLTGSGTEDYLTKWNGANSVTNSSVFDDGTNVGIGTTTPESKFEVSSSGGTNSGIGLRLTNPYSYGTIDFFTPSGLGGQYVLTGAGFVNGSFGGDEVALASELTSGVLHLASIGSNGIIRFTTGGNSTSNERMRITSNGNIGIGTTAPTEALYVVGNIYATGTITQNSDSKLKQNVTGIANGMSIINQLTPHTFNFDTTQYSWLKLPDGKQHGLIAQEVETVLPELITNSFYPEIKDTTGNIVHPRVDYKGINYTAFIPFLIQGMKEQDSIIKAQEIRLQTLESTVSTCCNSNAKTTGSMPSTDVELASKSAVLWQNFPNPFGDGTLIRYFVPENTASANIVFYDEFGNEIKTTDLTYKGQKAELNLSTLNLASGIYSYSLVVNGKNC